MNKFMKKIMSKKDGFTLVELIVVIAILAILAGIAVPAYSGYIARANDAACLSELSAIQTAAQACCALEGETLAGITISADNNGKVTITIDDSDTDTDAETYGINEFYTAPSNLMTTLEKHSNYKNVSSDGIQWTESVGWDLLADASDESD